MSNKKKRISGHTMPAAPQPRPMAVRHRRSRRSNLTFWLGGAAIAVVALIALSAWQTGALAKPAPPSRAETEADLLPLAKAVRPLSGGHDMARIPEATPAPQAAPKGVAVPLLQMPSADYDFGSIPVRPAVTHIFAVQSMGTADLVLRNLVTSCGCTTAKLSSSVIPAGQRADLTVTFDPGFHKVEGETTRLVWFGTNDPTQPWVEVRITADVSVKVDAP